jgi:hypothetical protein
MPYAAPENVPFTQINFIDVPNAVQLKYLPLDLKNG